MEKRLSAEDARSPAHSWSDSPGTNYADNLNVSLTLVSPIDLAAAANPTLCLFHKDAFASGDSGNAEISLNGSEWSTLRQFTGTTDGEWARARLDLSSYIGEPEVWLRFRVTTDSAAVADGWHLDDIAVAESPAAIGAPIISEIDSHSMRLSWNPAADYQFSDDFEATLEGWNTTGSWGLGSNDNHSGNAHLSGSPNNASYALSSTYTAETAVDISGSAWPVLTFHEGFESGLANWLHSAWRIDTNAAYAGSASVVDGDTLTVPGEYNQPVYHHLTLAGELPLAGTANPQLTFWVRGHLLGATYTYFRVQVSTNGGRTWADRPEANLNTGFNADWTRIQCDLTSYAGQTVRLRLLVMGQRYQPDIEINLDKITIAKRPVDATLNEIVAYAKSTDLSWTANPLGDTFQRYELYRDTAAGVDISDTLVGVFTNATTQSISDTGLIPGTKYYYRLFVVDTSDTYSQGSERSATATPIPVGFADNMESLDRWSALGTWGVDSNMQHSGSGCISDTPGTFYAPSSDTSLQTAVDLTGSDWPVLRFWDRYDLAAGDYATVDVSTDGNSWMRLYGVQDYLRTDWREHIIDLSPWKSSDNLRIRFRLAGRLGARAMRSQQLLGPDRPRPFPVAWPPL